MTTIGFDFSSCKLYFMARMWTVMMENDNSSIDTSEGNIHIDDKDKSSNRNK